jgi:hypothetical protein
MQLKSPEPDAYFCGLKTMRMNEEVEGCRLTRTFRRRAVVLTSSLSRDAVRAFKLKQILESFC